ncbi:P antigen family member 4 [Eptesicus fuscus]|uniref:P antigen family member 4 n=1 Tax=Eptesicus fuscus TaxID=29078 RepID=UPI00101A5C47|nr:P antigen family member 4 [Eptesicus fuscus]XP_027990759.1 P antigen family member 4 [Eptesicus fuscus]
MNARLRSRSRGRPDGQESFDPFKPVVAQQPSDKKTEEEPPVGGPNNEPGQKRGEGAPVVKGESQKMALGETRDECADGSDGEEKIPAILAPAKIPKGDGQ